MFFRIFFIFLLLVALGSPLTAKAEPISIVAVGDLLLGGSATKRIKQSGFSYPFAATGDYLRQADIAMANLEAPLTDAKEPTPDKKYTFKVSPKAAAEFKQAGFDLMTLANNHIGDFGQQGVLDTLEALTEAGLGFAGAGKNLQQAREPYVIEVDGAKLAFLAYSNTFPKSFYAKKRKPGTAFGNFDHVATDTRNARKLADYVIVSFHWGAELMAEPKDYQQELGRVAIDNGAQVVIGHHPHILQGAEIYKDGVIYYSLGNYAFGSYSRNAVTAGMARVWLENGKLVKAEILPLNILNVDVHFQPKPLSHGPAYLFARNFIAACEPLNTTLRKQPDLFWRIEKIKLAGEGQGQVRHQGTKDTKESL